MTSINLGYQPTGLTVTLVRGCDFLSSLVSPSDWPAGTSIELHLQPADPAAAPIVWSAAITAASAAWQIPYQQVDVALDAGVRDAALVYTAPEVGTVVWARGRAFGD